MQNHWKEHLHSKLQRQLRLPRKVIISFNSGFTFMAATKFSTGHSATSTQSISMTISPNSTGLKFTAKTESPLVQGQSTLSLEQNKKSTSLEVSTKTSTPPTISFNLILKPKPGPNSNPKDLKKYPESILLDLHYCKKKASKLFTSLEATTRKRPKCPTQFTNLYLPKTKSPSSFKITLKNKVPLN